MYVIILNMNFPMVNIKAVKIWQKHILSILFSKTIFSGGVFALKASTTSFLMMLEMNMDCCQRFFMIMFCCSGQVYIASSNHVWRLAPVPITTQIKDLLLNKEFELALQLAVSIHSLGAQMIPLYYR